MIMSSVIVTTTGLTAVILSSLQQSRAIDNAIVAYYAAESGVEESVFRLRRDGVMPPSSASPQSLANNSAWTVTVAPSEPVVYAGNLTQDSFTEIALYDPDQPTTATNIASVSVTWLDDCLGCSVLEAAMVSWLSGGPIAWDPNAATYRFTGGSATLSAASGKLYRLRLMARSGGFQNVQVRAYDVAGAAVPVPGRVRIEAIGAFSTVRQRLTAVMPRELPLSGLYDFVVFTECSLVKGGTVSCP
jgi:hypothetical protein